MLERERFMIFEIETMEPSNFPIGSIHTVTDWNYGNPIERTGKVLRHKPPMPAICMASFPRIVFETVNNTKE